MRPMPVLKPLESYARVYPTYTLSGFGFDNCSVHLISNCSHPGLVMEHYDPTTSVHTFKIAYPRRQHDEYHQLSSPVTPTLSNSSRLVCIPS
jgi:hypothetical protein